MFISLPHCTVENAALERRPIPRPVLGARDGATIVNYLHWFYETAYGRASTIVETCYFSNLPDKLARGGRRRGFILVGDYRFGDAVLTRRCDLGSQNLAEDCQVCNRRAAALDQGRP
jgi:hypothetical protein